MAEVGCSGALAVFFGVVIIVAIVSADGERHERVAICHERGGVWMQEFQGPGYACYPPADTISTAPRPRDAD